jgi:hypothetical protein
MTGGVVVDYTDRPVTRVIPRDPLQFDRYCSVLTEVIRATETPITIGIFGPWGSGKTSLMRMIEHSLQETKGKEKGHPQVLSVWFDAWQYGHDEALWRALLVCVLDALRNLPEQDWQGSAEQKIDLLGNLDRLEESLYRTVEWEELGRWTVDWAQAIQSVVGGAVDLALTFVPGAAPLVELLRQVKNTVSDDEREAIAEAFHREVREYRRQQVCSAEQFQRGFQAILQQYADPQRKRLVVFVDDLDRCVPEKAIEVLEAIKLFLNAPGCIFVLGADRDVIEKGIRVKYQSFLLGSEEELAEEDLLRRIPITGQDYMEKIVQLPFSLPALRHEQIETFVRSLLPDLGDCAPVFAWGLEANPRKIKRGIHVFHILRRLAELGEIPDLNPVLLAKMVIIQSRYRRLYTDILQDPAVLTDLERFALGEGELPVLSEVGKGDLSERDARLRLRRMLAEPPHFKKLPGDWLDLYIYLSRATSEERGAITRGMEEAPEEMDKQLLQDLLSNNVDWIRDAVESIRVVKGERAYAERLLDRLETDTLMPAARRSMGIALALLSDPRDFDEMIQVPGQKLRLGKYPVTNGQFRRFVEAGGYTSQDYWDDNGWRWASVSQIKRPLLWDRRHWDHRQTGNHPVTGVNWYEARAYCSWLSERDGKTYRLPTVEEWLLAAQGNGEQTYPWGDKFGLDRANTLESNLQTATAVGLYPGGSSPCGVLDMAGNTWEWTITEGEQPGTQVLKGGSWRDSAAKARCQASNFALPAFRDPTIGFRVLCESQ